MAFNLFNTSTNSQPYANTLIGKGLQYISKKENVPYLSGNPSEVLGKVSSSLWQSATSIKNVGYSDDAEQKKKDFISQMLSKWYKKEAIFKAMDKIDSEWGFQGDLSSNPITGTLSSVVSAPIQAASTLAGGLSKYSQWSENLYDKNYAAGIAQAWQGIAQSSLGALWLATGFNPSWAAVNTAFSSDTVSKPLEKYVSQPIMGVTSGIQSGLWFDPTSEASRSIQETTWILWPLAVLWASQKYIAPKIAPTVKKTVESGADILKKLWKINPKISESVGKKWIEEIYQAVNPTTRENKAQLRNRVDDLLPYIDEKSIFNNDLETVKSRVDVDKTKAFSDMSQYESLVWVKGSVDIKPIISKLNSEFKKTTSKWVIIDESQARLADELISKLEEFWPVIKDSDILTIRRAWDTIIEKNKWFMQSADANTKWEIYYKANKFLRDEIKKSNPTYAKYLESASKTIALSDILDATIQRRTGQTQWGFIRKASENVARVVGTWLWASIWGVPWAIVWGGATELLLWGVNKLTWSSAKLARWKRLILKQNENATRNNGNSDSGITSVPSKPKLWAVRPWLVKPKVKPALKQTGNVLTRNSATNASPLEKAKSNTEEIIKGVQQKSAKEQANKNYINPDEYREYINEGWKLSASETHEAASYLAEEHFARALDDAIKSGNKTARIVAGWPWAWKGTAWKLQGNAEFWLVVDKVLWDKELSRLLENGFDITYDVVIPSYGNVAKQIIWRAASKKRTLPIKSVAIPGHNKVINFVESMITDPKYQGVNIRFIDNTGKTGEQHFAEDINTILKKARLDIKNLNEKNILEEAGNALQDGKITKQQHDELISFVRWMKRMENIA